MRTYELYINDIICDLAEEESISLIYESGIFSPLDSIQSNRTHTIELPMTDRNSLVFGLASRLDVDTTIPYRRLPARMYADGVEIFTRGYATLTGIDENSMSVVLTWGNVENFAALFDSKLSDLSDVLDGLNSGHIEWNEDSVILTAPSEGSGLPMMGFFAIDYGQGLSKPQYIHPSIMAQQVLRAIALFHNIEIKDIGRLSPTLLIPCVSKNGDKISGEFENTIAAMSFTKPLDNDYVYAYPYKIDSHAEYVENNYVYNVAGANEIYISFSAEITLLPNDFAIELFHPYIADADDPNTPLFEIPYTRDTWEVSINLLTTLTNEQIPTSGRFVIVLFDKNSVGVNTLLAYMTSALIFHASPRDIVSFPSKYPIAANLPDMSHGDFISQLLMINGLYAYFDISKPNTINLFSIDDILENRNAGIYMDWSNRLHPGIITEFAIENIAQHNIFRYENDDNVKVVTEGYIDVDNTNLEEEAEAVTLQFSATDNTRTNSIIYANIPIYESKEKSNENGEIVYNELSPRIVTYRENVSIEDGVTPWCYGVFTSQQHFSGKSGIIAQKYQGLKKILKNVRVVSVQVELSVLELSLLDYTKPVFLSQYGQYFAISRVETQEGNICDCELILLN